MVHPSQAPERLPCGRLRWPRPVVRHAEGVECEGPGAGDCQGPAQAPLPIPGWPPRNGDPDNKRCRANSDHRRSSVLRLGSTPARAGPIADRPAPVDDESQRFRDGLHWLREDRSRHPSAEHASGRAGRWRRSTGNLSPAARPLLAPRCALLPHAPPRVRHGRC